MGIRDSEKPQVETPLFQSSHDFALFADRCLRRLKTDGVAPVISAEQLELMKPRPEEEIVVRSVYDRFSAKLPRPPGAS